jgi:hypothetical protein
MLASSLCPSTSLSSLTQRVWTEYRRLHKRFTQSQAIHGWITTRFWRVPLSPTRIIFCVEADQTRGRS